MQDQRPDYMRYQYIHVALSPSPETTPPPVRDKACLTVFVAIMIINVMGVPVQATYGGGEWANYYCLSMQDIPCDQIFLLTVGNYLEFEMHRQRTMMCFRGDEIPK